jgi:hypothetical protein
MVQIENDRLKAYAVLLIRTFMPINGTFIKAKENALVHVNILLVSSELFTYPMEDAHKQLKTVIEKMTIHDFH